jgi:hypothetical protein
LSGSAPSRTGHFFSDGQEVTQLAFTEKADVTRSAFSLAIADGGRSERAMSPIANPTSFAAILSCGTISHDEDERRAVVLEVMARLRDDGFRRLRLFAATSAREPGLSLLPWLEVVARRVAVDCLRAHPNYLAAPRTGGTTRPRPVERPAFPAARQLASGGEHRGLVPLELADDDRAKRRVDSLQGMLARRSPGRQ